MKKIIILFLVILFCPQSSFTQVRVTLILTNFHFESNLLAVDVQAVIPPGQFWSVWSSNIRVSFSTIPSGSISIHPESPVSGALTCLDSGYYARMSTTSLNGGTIISLNITHLSGPRCTLTTSGSPYLLGRVRFNILQSNFCIIDSINHNTLIMDSITPLVYGTQWNAENSDSCRQMIVGVKKSLNPVPVYYKLYNNYPNPFNLSTLIKYDIPKSTIVKLVVYDILGKQVDVLVNERQDGGSYEIKWDGTCFSSGSYYIKMETDTYTQVKKMLLVK